MMDDNCQVKVLNGVEVQENGIIRNSKGRIIARLVDSVEFDSEHLEQTKPLSDEEIEAIITDCGYQIEETVTGKFVDIEGINMYNSFKGFARAIEAKVRGEK
jgi:hypothetical protein